MSRFVISAFVLLATTLLFTVAIAQDQDQNPLTATGKTFKLLRDDGTAENDLALSEEEVEVWDPTLKKGSIELSLGIGFMGMTSTLLQHDQMIYKYNTDATYWGDVEIKGESAFAPTLRIGYSLTDWFVIEGWSGVSISEYTTSISNARSRKNEAGAPVVENPPVLEFDPEHRSLITLQAGANAMWYPLAVHDASGRWHPYVTGGVGNMWYSMNSNYTDETASAMDMNFGGGIRLLADRNVSIRAEVLLHRNTLEWTPADHFTELNEGTTLVPHNEYPVLTNGSIDERPITKFESNDLTILHWTLSIQGSF